MADYTTFELERMAAGEREIPPDAAERVERLQRENDEVLAQYPAGEMVPKIFAAPRPRSRRAPVMLGLAGLAAVSLVALWPNDLAEPPPDEPRVRLKGPEVRLHIYKESPGGEVRLADGDQVVAGDVVQARFGIAKRAFVAHYSVDGVGTVTPIEPPTLDAEMPAYDGGTHQAPTSTELDDAPDFERFFVVACDERFIVRDVVDRVDRGNLPPSCEVESVELRK